jgi:6-phosphofructokinase 1
VLITRQEGRIIPVPFADLLDPRTGRSRVRQVDVTSDSYANAFALQERILAEDLEDRSRLASIAEAAKLSPDEARERYAPR